jgi:hypothetical protein
MFRLAAENIPELNRPDQTLARRWQLEAGSWKLFSFVSHAVAGWRTPALL